MKKNIFSIAGITLAGALLFSSCIGSFGLTKKILAWNQTIDNKFVNEVIFVALWIVPVYEVCMIADVLVINSIEFWSGENPVEAGIVKQVQGENGIYTVETLENGYHIQDQEGQEMELVYDKATNTWSSVAKGETKKILTFEDDNNAIVYLPNGEQKRVELSNEGVLDLRQTIESGIYFAAK